MMQRLRSVLLLLPLLATLGCRDEAPTPLAPDMAITQHGQQASPLKFTYVGAGGGYSCGLMQEGKAYCWGRARQSGSDVVEGVLRVPTAVAGGHRFRSLDVGGGHSCALTPSGSAYCWGYGGNLALGNGSTEDALTPVEVAGGLRFEQISAGFYQTCALTRSGEAFCWGRGAGTPTPVSGGLRFRQISSGVSHTCALTAAGVAYCWGTNSFGELGFDTPWLGSSTPVKAAEDLRFAQISAGYSYTCAITRRGEGYCWGISEDDQLGNLPPETVVAGDLRWLSIDAGSTSTCGVTRRGKAYCWGLNEQGQLGTGTVISTRVPVPVAGDARFRQISVGAVHACATTGRGEAYCWGANQAGQLGDGTTSLYSLVPVRVVPPS